MSENIVASGSKRKQLPLILDGKYFSVIFEAEDFLKDYKMAMYPVAAMIDDLQSEKDFCYGYLVPTLLTGFSKLEAIIAELPSTRYAVAIARELRERLLDRFPGIFNFDLQLSKNEIIATICLPAFKLNWRIPADKSDEIKTAFIKEAEKFYESPVTSTQNTSQKDLSSKWSEIKTTSIARSQVLSAELECLKYFEDPDESYNCLWKYPVIRRMFFPFNVALPSSAPAERLFSYGGMILRPRRSRLSDETFEQLCFLKLYKDL